MKILIAGGEDDPNLQGLIEVAQKWDVTIIPLLTGSDVSPMFTWSLKNGELHINDTRISVNAAFVRRNVFHLASATQHDRSSAWYSSVIGFLMAHPKVKTMNRLYMGANTNKLYILYLANKLGLNIPETTITNVPADFPDNHLVPAVAKPVIGGGYCEEINNLLEDMELRSSVSANPAIVQQQVKGEDIRFYRIGELFLGFKIRSEILDYRKSEKPEINFISDLPGDIITILKKLMDIMGLNWGAADFKLDEKSGKYYFLEVNSNPMFSVFDNVCGGQISNSIFSFLTKR